MSTRFTCPESGRILDFHTEDDMSLSFLWLKPIYFHCPFCPNVHDVDIKRAYIRSVMSEFKCLPADVKEAMSH